MKVRPHDCWTVAALYVNELIDCPLLAVRSSSNPWLCHESEKLLILCGIYSPWERVDGLDSQGQLFCKEGSGLFCLHNLEMVEQQTFYMLYYQHSWASSTSTECHVLPLILTKNAPAEIL